jgi:UDP-N-acetylmuramyl pentapeptide phosphotransferase/UDP-N-acetylglucosamine-1-phosphate transferase
MAGMSDFWLLAGQLALIAAVAGVVSYGLIAILGAYFARYALAQPNARSSHREPTPQGGGIAVIGATIVVIAGCVLAGVDLNDLYRLGMVFCAAVLLTLVGATDDVRPLSAAPRLVLQIAAALLVVAAIPTELWVVHWLPFWLERGLMLLGMVWFINLVNFMDGIDWMSVAEIVPVTAGLSILGLMGELPRDATVVAAGLLGAVLGFAPFNRPVARLFLGDVGSLPIGLLLVWMLILLAAQGHFAAAILLPLYYLADSTITLLQRLQRGAPIAEAHRDHFYQRAVDGGLGIYRVVGSVFAVNLVLVLLALISVLNPSIAYQVILLILGCAGVGIVLWNFRRPIVRRTR